MMRLQRVGRKNDPSYRIVITDKRTGPKSNKHVAILGSYNPRMDGVQIKADEAKEWIAKGVQLSPTVHNLLVNEKVIEGKKVNVLPKKSPVVDPEAEAKKAEEEAAAAETETNTEEAPVEDTPVEAEAAEETKEETEVTEESKEEAPVEEVKEESPVKEEVKAEEEEAPTEEKKD